MFQNGVTIEFDIGQKKNSGHLVFENVDELVDGSLLVLEVVAEPRRVDHREHRACRRKPKGKGSSLVIHIYIELSKPLIELSSLV